MEITPAFQRLFLAIAIPTDVRAAIGRAQSQLQRHAPPGAVRWTRPDQFHVTLKFLGDVPTESIAALEKSAAGVCAQSPALRLSARGIGFFPNERKPRVIWVGADDDRNQLPELFKQLDAALRWLSPAEKPDRFSGHITLGRFKPGHHATIPNLLERAAVLRGRHFGDWLAAEVELIRSDLSSAGAMHTVSASFPLKV